MKGNAIVAGAGIGGLAAGLALLRKGWQVRIYEQSDDIRILGAAIYIWENGLRVLETLGIYEQVTAGMQQVQVRERRGAKGELLGVENTAASGRLFLPMRRALLTSLKDAVLAAGGEFHFGKPVQGADPAGGLRFRDGTVEHGDLVVGADGMAVIDALNINLCDSAGRSALAWACIKRRPECVRLLLERADLDTASRDARGFNTADLALGHAGMLEMLRAKGIVPS